MPGGSSAGSRLDSLTGLRFIAAALVVVVHTDSTDPSNGIVHLPFLEPVAKVGYLGVNFFFVLSGFVLTWSARPGPKKSFYQRRFARVYPLNAVTWLLALLYLLSKAHGASIGIGTAVSCLVLLQAWYPNINVYFGINGVAWSLSCEAFFYALHPFLLPLLERAKRLLPIAAGAAALAFLAAFAQLHLPHLPSATDVWVFPPFGLTGFVVGMCAGVALRRGWRSPLGLWPALLLTVGVFAALAGWDEHPGPFGTGELSRPLAAAIFVIPVALLIQSAATSDLAGRRSVFATRPFVRLGEWSFALYMTHELVGDAFLKVFHGSPPHGSAANWVRELLFYVVAIAVSAVAYAAVERPLELRLRPKSSPHRVSEPV